MLTIKSDDIKGRSKTYEAIVRSRRVPEPGIPESFNVLSKEIMGLGFNMYMIDEQGDKLSINAYEEEEQLSKLFDDESLEVENLSIDNQDVENELEDLTYIDEKDILESFGFNEEDEE
ncbi:hypothetical protein JIY74_30835 [Vibrio harveyi]|nr:hypothetical protein [Vibrio harveyi]